MRVNRIIIALLIATTLTSCATTRDKPIPNQPSITSPATLSQLAYGKSLFQDGFYKKAMQQLLPIAAEGNMEAQYAVGYMYYYGYGTTQDTSSGIFWIKRSADQHFEPAIKAYAMIEQKKITPPKTINN